MTIKAGDRVPSVTLRYLTKDGMQQIASDDFFKGKKVVLFAVPGAYTRTCSQRHLPSYVNNADQLQAKGVDTIACLAVNDPFVMDAWGREHGADRIVMLGDGSADFTKAIGLELDRTSAGMGMRSQRYAMLVEDGIVKALHVEPSGEYGVSSAEAMLAEI
ncbi:MAG TPA: peroxiredoxin [Stellaceae bacterium]|nr:peroxiredoxin [Stellaceae bacterium]